MLILSTGFVSSLSLHLWNNGFFWRLQEPPCTVCPFDLQDLFHPEVCLASLSSIYTNVVNEIFQIFVNSCDILVLTNYVIQVK